MFKNLQAELVRAGITNSEMAEMLGMSKVLFSQRINGHTSWTLREMIKIQEEINTKLGTEYSLDYLFSQRQDERS